MAQRSDSIALSTYTIIKKGGRSEIHLSFIMKGHGLSESNTKGPSEKTDFENSAAEVMLRAPVFSSTQVQEYLYRTAKAQRFKFRKMSRSYKMKGWFPGQNTTFRSRRTHSMFRKKTSNYYFSSSTFATLSYVSGVTKQEARFEYDFTIRSRKKTLLIPSFSIINQGEIFKTEILHISLTSKM